MPHQLIENGELILFGTVGADPGNILFEDGFNARQVVEALAEMDGDITVRVNSWGGIVSDGVAIFNALSNHDGNVTVRVDGIAASAASVIAMAGDDIIVPENAMMMVHNASGVTIGSAVDHRKQADTLEKFDGQITEIFAKRTGLSEDGITMLLNAETWMTGSEAKEKGFADQSPGTPKKRRKETNFVDPRIALYANVPENLMAAVMAAGKKPTSVEMTPDPDNGEKTMSEKPTMTAEMQAEVDAAIKAAEDAARAEAKEEAEKEAAEAAKVEAEATKAQMIENMSQIVSACAIAGVPEKAVNFISEEKPINEVLSELETLRAKKREEEITANITGASDDAADIWNKVVEDRNARH